MRKQRGEILVEALLGLAITIIIITGLIVALNSSVSNSTFSTNQSQASLIAKEGLDLVKNIKEDNYSSIDLTGYYCLNNSVLKKDCFQEVDGDNLKFSRQFYISRDGKDYRKIPAGTSVCNKDGTAVFAASIVTWWDSKCGSNISAKCHKVELNSCFTDLTGI